VRAVGDRLGEAMTAGDAAAVRALLATDVTFESLKGADAVSARLVEVGKGGRVATTRADEKAVSIHLVTADGAHLHVRCFGDAAAVHRIAVQG
jgi:hypothetical protein